MASSTPLPSLIPLPVQVHRLPGRWTLLAEARISALPEVGNEADYLASRLRRATGHAFPVGPAEPGPHDFSLALNPALDPARFGEEGYRLFFPYRQGVRIEARSRAGLFHGIQTLLQLFPPAIFSAGPRERITWDIPIVEIDDAPRFGWRGAMLDTSRHFMPKEFVKKFIDLLAFHKLNVFHWHLIDDQGWRLEIKRYPKLTEVGAFRSETLIGHLDLNGPGDGVPHGGFYTQDDVREIVTYAAARHIQVVPEIEMPGHNQAAIAAYPELGCTGRSPGVSTRWGIHETLFNVEESTIQFLQNVLEEVLDLFPSPFIHIGGDEAAKREWEETPAIQQRMKELGIPDTHTLQSWFIRRMDEFLTAKGRRLIGWDEILEGGLAPGATVMSWRGMEGGVEAARADHDVVMAAKQWTYLDFYQSQEMEKEPISFSEVLPLEQVYSFDPVPPELSEGEQRHILGVQGQIWTEYVPTPSNAEYKAFPRLTALAEVGWSPASKKDYASFLERLPDHLRRLDILETRYRPL